MPDLYYISENPYPIGTEFVYSGRLYKKDEIPKDATYVYKVQPRVVILSESIKQFHMSALCEFHTVNDRLQYLLLVKDSVTREDIINILNKCIYSADTKKRIFEIFKEKIAKEPLWYINQAQTLWHHDGELLAYVIRCILDCCEGDPCA